MHGRKVSRSWLIALILSATFVGPWGCRSPGDPDKQAPTGGAAQRGRRPPVPMPRPVRAVWVARFHFRTPDDIRRIVENAAAVGCNTVLWQVRGEGTVGYRSRLEPWWKEFNHCDPGFDPLALAVQEAHRRGLRVEAWMNVMPGWRGRTPPPPTNPPQLSNAHPDWFLHDAAGVRQPFGDYYVVVNPCLPEVRRHIAAVAEEIVSRYDVDGLHLDYVRYAWDGVPKAKQNFPRDARTLALYRQDSGKRPDDDVRAWDEWRANRITQLVGEIRSVVNRARPGASLTAAVWRNPQIAYNEYLQNGTAWLKAGWLDALMPMTYTDKLRQFDTDVAAYRRIVGNRRIVPGIGLYTHERIGPTREQLARVNEWGGDVALFSYESLYPTGAAAAKSGAKSDPIRAARRDAVRAAIGAR
jgi:uncharacterized lipoprotein YddW (UPF0748 family)